MPMEARIISPAVVVVRQALEGLKGPGTEGLVPAAGATLCDGAVSGRKTPGADWIMVAAGAVKVTGRFRIAGLRLIS